MSEQQQKSKHQERIEEMMRKIGQSLPKRPTVPSDATRLLRAKLILEEALETIEALGISVAHSMPDGYMDISEIQFDITGDVDMVGVCDGCADISVVTIGTLSSIGVPDVPLLEIVDRNNLNKFGPGHYIREDGKLVKPPGFKGPETDIENLIKYYQFRG